MKDLKHLIFFEDLLQEANNKLVRQAKDEGKFAWATPVISCLKCSLIFPAASRSD